MAVTNRVTLAGRIRKFFVDNPEEELTYDQLQVKFGCKPSQAHDAIRHLRDRCEVETAYVIRAGKAPK